MQPKQQWPTVIAEDLSHLYIDISDITVTSPGLHIIITIVRLFSFSQWLWKLSPPSYSSNIQLSLQTNNTTQCS